MPTSREPARLVINGIGLKPVVLDTDEIILDIENPMGSRLDIIHATQVANAWRKGTRQRSWDFTATGILLAEIAAGEIRQWKWVKSVEGTFVLADFPAPGADAAIVA